MPPAPSPTATRPTAAGASAARSGGRAGRRTKGEGQWALGYFTPLNATEQLKKDDDGLNVRQRILDIYSKTGFEGIDGQDLRGRMRWWGLYTQRRQGIPGGQTASLEPDQLEDEYFMMRVRIDGGQLSLAQLRAIAELSTAYARDTADITDRQNIQYHWVRIEDVPAIWQRLESVGLNTQEACGDVPRVMLGSPVAGVAKDEIVDGTWALAEIKRRYLGNPDFSNLPRKYKTSVSGSPRQDVAPELDDVSFVGVRHPELGPGFDVWVGGGLSTNPMLAQRIGAFVTLEEVPEIWAGVTGIFRDYGYRRLRNRARMKFLVADWGTEKFRQVLEDEYLHRKLPDGPAPTPPHPDDRDHIGVHEQNDGRFYIGAAPRTGRVSGTLLSKVADLAASVGSDRVRLTPQQHLLILDVPAERVDEIVGALEALDLPVKPSTFRRGTLACTGLEYCKLAIVETKHRASEVIDELERRLPDFDAPLSLHLNGCPNSCARIQTADIGLKGMVMTGPNGEHVDGFQVHLGGGLGQHAGFGRKLRGLKVTADELPDYVERLARRYAAQRHGDEPFAAWVARAEEADLT